MEITDKEGYLKPEYAQDVKVYLKSGLRKFSLSKDLLNKILNRSRRVQDEYRDEVNRLVEASQKVKKLLMSDKIYNNGSL